MTELEKYYNKFNEEHRLSSRHGQVEFNTTFYFIHQYIKEKPLKILDIGAGTGRYSVQLCHEGHDVTAVELVKRNLEILRKKHENIKTWNANAMSLPFLEDETFDLTLLLGPMYHLSDFNDKVKALNEAKRVTKKGGIIFIAYCMNEYSVLTYCFREKNILKCINEKTLTDDFHGIFTGKDLYNYVRLEDINLLNKETNSKRIKIFAPDGPADYFRREINALSQKEFEYFKEYILKISERPELLGSSSHIVDVIENT